jgi:branched-chain amino acid transport system substrate-binding protein
MRRRGVLAVAILAALALLVGACGGDDGGTTPAALSCDPNSLKALGRTAGGASVAGEISAARVGAAPLAQAKPEVKIGQMGDYTGSNSSLVIHARDAVKLAFKLANAAGDLPVTVTTVDLDNKEAAPATAPALAQRLINDPKVVGVVGPAFSGETSAVGPLFKQAGLTHITPSATRADLTAQGWNTFFRSVGGDTDQAAAGGKLLVAMKCKKVALVNDKSAYGQGLAEIVKKELTAANVEVVLDEGIAPTTDYTTLVDSLLAKQPDAVFYGGYVAQGPLIVKQMRAKGVKAPFVCGDGCKDDKFVTDGGADAEGALFTCPCLDPNVSSAADAKDFVAKFRAEYNRAPGVYGAEGWDIAQMYIAAFKAGKTTRADVLAYITALKDFKGLTKTFNWTTDPQALHEVTDKGVNIYAIRGGKLVLLGPIGKFTA